MAEETFQNEDRNAVQPPFSRAMRWMLSRQTWPAPASRHASVPFPSTPPPPGDLRVTFIGHCTLVIEMGGLRILTDPHFGERASPVPFLGPRRYHPPGVPLEDLPAPDIVLVSHNHYDHLDAPTIARLGTAPHYVVPQGLGAWFRARGCKHVTERRWWEELDHQGLRIVAVPTQHWSRRTPFDTNKSHWCGFALESGDLRFLFVGDSGYNDGFRRIADRLGAFHACALPIGAYEPRWMMERVHMNPEEAVQAFDDLQGGVLVPTHYNCFPLADEDPADPPRRLYKEWRRRGLEIDRLWMLAPGQYRSLEDITYIPTVQATTERVPRKEGDRLPPMDPIFRNRFAEWGVAICPHKGEMVDVESVGHRGEVFQGDGGRTLTLDYVTCSAHGTCPECATPACPLRDPAFLRSYGLHGSRREDGSIEPFVEVDSPPEPRWWGEKLRVQRKED